MLNFKYISLLSIPFTLFLNLPSAWALPGEASDKVAAWIRSHPTLRPNSGETLMVRKSDTPSRRFTFQASVLSPGRTTPTANQSVISYERIELYDQIKGISPQELEESLRTIYGTDIYQDYQQSQVVYQYPSPGAVFQARAQNVPLREELQGQLRVGNRFAYWIEIAQPRNGNSILGKMTVFLKEDLEKMQTELQSR